MWEAPIRARVAFDRKPIIMQVIDDRVSRAYRGYTAPLVYLVGSVPTGTGTYNIPEHFCLISERVVLVLE